MQNKTPITEGELLSSGIIGAGEAKPKRVRVKKSYKVETSTT